MFGLIMSIIAGAAMSVQGVLNTRLSSKIGLFESNVFVQGIAFLIGLFVMWIFGKGNFRELVNTPKVYWLGGLLGMVITVTVMLSIKGLSPTYAISVILISQLLVAALIDAFGWFESEKVPFTWSKYLGLFLMISGVVLFQWQKGR